MESSTAFSTPPRRGATLLVQRGSPDPANYRTAGIPTNSETFGRSFRRGRETFAKHGPRKTPSLRHLQPLLVESFFRRGDCRAEFLSEDRNAIFLAHPAIHFELSVVELSSMIQL